MIRAVICEYNPFHNGHLINLEMMKQSPDDKVIAIMSGNFVQRGEPAIFDKYARAKAAVLCGADLVIELPYPFCCSSANLFSDAGVSLCDSLGIVDELWFGSENGDISCLKAISEKLASEKFEKAFSIERSKKENEKYSHAVLSQRVYESLFGKAYPSSPNDILAVEYLIALEKSKSKIKPFTYKRKDGFSATKARKLYNSGASVQNDVPEIADGIFKNEQFYSWKFAERFVLGFYRSADPKKLALCDGMNDGLANAVRSCASDATSTDEFFGLLSSKNHTDARIRRAVLAGMCGVKKDRLSDRVRFTNVLSFNDNGRILLKAIKKNGKICVITKPAHKTELKGKTKEQAILCEKADELYTLFGEKSNPEHTFVKNTPYYHKSK